MKVNRWIGILFAAASVLVIIRMSVWLISAGMSREALPPDAAEEEVVMEGGEPVAPAPDEPASAELPDEPVTEPEPPVTTSPPPAPEPEPESVPPPETFDLRRIRWGMTRAEVLAAETNAPVREKEQSLVYSIRTLDMPCLLTYDFLQDRLVRARLAFSGSATPLVPPLSVARAQQRFLFLREQLSARYGEPRMKTVHANRDSSGFQQMLQKQEEVAAQYDQEIAEARARLERKRLELERRFEHWSDRNERVDRGLAASERDLEELKEWKQEALDQARESRENIRANRQADRSHPLTTALMARWSSEQAPHDVELLLDFRSRVPRLELRYESPPLLPADGEMDEL